MDASGMAFRRVVETDLPVMYTAEAVAGDPSDASRKAFERLEAQLESLRGRRAYGLYFHGNGEYRACVSLQADEEPERIGLERGVVPGGAYLKARLKGDPDEIYPQIPRTFSKMVEDVDPDPARPSIEFYRRHDEVVLLLPILESD